jgi:xylulokinase
MNKKRLSLGLDVSTQGISAVVLDIDTRSVVYEHSLDYCRDARLHSYGIRKEDYILPPENEGEASQPPQIFLAALDAIFQDLKEAVAPKNITVINSSGQQHGHVYLNSTALSAFRSLIQEDSARSNLVTLMKNGLSYDRAPIWMTSDTAEQAAQIRNNIGGKKQAIELSGSDVPLRFTGVVMRKIAQQHPDVYKNTENIQLISSLIAAILTGNSKAPVDSGNACGMSLMDYTHKSWSDVLIKAVSDGLPGGAKAFRSKLPPIVAPDAIVGTVASYFVGKYGFSPLCRVVAGSGDNPQSKVPVAGDLLSLGTSIVIMAATDGKTFDMNGYANAMYDGTGRPFIFGCRTNGAMVWDRLRMMYGLKKEDYLPAEEALRQTPLAQNMVFWQPRNESFPLSGSQDLTRTGGEKPGLGADYAGIIETTLAAVYLHSKSFMKETTESLYVTGGAAKSPGIIRRVAAIWGRPVIPIAECGAALGAAVAGAGAFLKSEGKITDATQYISASFLKKERLVRPKQADVLSFHRPGGYLERLAVEEARLLSL